MYHLWRRNYTLRVIRLKNTVYVNWILIPCATHHTPVDGQTLGRVPLPEGFYLDSLLLLGHSYRHKTWNKRQEVMISSTYRKQKKLLKDFKVQMMSTLTAWHAAPKIFFSIYCPLLSIQRTIENSIPIVNTTKKPPSNKQRRSSWLNIILNHKPNRKTILEKSMSWALEVSLDVAWFASRIISMKYFSLWRIPSWTQQYKPQTGAKLTFPGLI